MKNTTAKPAQKHAIPMPDMELRLKNAKNMTIELTNQRLRKIDGRSTDARKALQSRLIHAHKPWTRSTGPKSANGKARSALNATKHGFRSREARELARTFRDLRDFRKGLLEKHRAKKAWGRYKRRTMVTIDQALVSLKQTLKDAGIDNPALDARILVREAMGLSDTDMITAGRSEPTPSALEKLTEWGAQRAAGRPVSKILGYKEFYGRRFSVTDDTLDPRPDTETLIEVALKSLKTPLPLGEGNKASSRSGGSVVGEGQNITILDLGTGTGCILITLLCELPHASGIAADVSNAALAIAKQNAKTHGVDSRAAFIQSDWFENITGTFDLIVSNPPYIPNPDIATLAKEVRNHDPILALDGGNDGLDCYKKIISNLKTHLKPGGKAVFEIGINQGENVSRLVDDSNLCMVGITPDIAGTPRVVEISYGEK